MPDTLMAAGELVPGTPSPALRGVEALLASDPSIGVLVNNAGFGGAGTMEQSGVDDMERMIAVNVTAVMRLFYAAAPAFAARSKGTIINIVAVAPETLNGVYGGSKSFVLAFSRSLKKELADKGVTVQVVLPGATATAFGDIAGMPHSNLPEAWVMTPATLVDAALADRDAGHFASIPSLQDEAQWQAWETAREAMMGGLSSREAAPRYAKPKPPETGKNRGCDLWPRFLFDKALKVQQIAGIQRPGRIAAQGVGRRRSSTAVWWRVSLAAQLPLTIRPTLPSALPFGRGIPPPTSSGCWKVGSDF